jgi:hypothetical protein
MAMKDRGNTSRGQDRSSQSSSSSSGDMSVREAGHKGGQKVRELIEKGKQRSSER